jgi:hypothetical protein
LKKQPEAFWIIVANYRSRQFGKTFRYGDRQSLCRAVGIGKKISPLRADLPDNIGRLRTKTQQATALRTPSVKVIFAVQPRGNHANSSI